MDKRAGLRQFYQEQASTQMAQKQYQQRTAQLNELENTVIESIGALIRFLDGKTTKTEVINQLTSISTPDVDKVVEAVSKLDKDILANQLDLKPLVTELQQIKREMSLVPKSLPKFEQKDAVKVTNLSDVKLDTTKLEKLIKDLKLDPTIEVKPTDVQVDAPDLKPLETALKAVVTAIKNQKYPEFPEIPVTDLSEVEKKLDESNKHLKDIATRPANTPSSNSPYINSDNKLVNVPLETDLSIPITLKNPGDISGSTVYSKPTDAYELVQYDDSTSSSYEYYLYSDKDANYYVKRVDTNYNYTEFKSSVTPVTGSGFYAWVSALSSWQTYGAAF